MKTICLVLSLLLNVILIIYIINIHMEDNRKEIFSNCQEREVSADIPAFMLERWYIYDPEDFSSSEFGPV